MWCWDAWFRDPGSSRHPLLAVMNYPRVGLPQSLHQEWSPAPAWASPQTLNRPSLCSWISEDCMFSACHLTICQSEMTAPECLPASFLTNLGDRIIVSPSVLHPSITKDSFQNKSSCFFFIAKALVASALARGVAELELGMLFGKLLVEATPAEFRICSLMTFELWSNCVLLHSRSFVFA